MAELTGERVRVCDCDVQTVIAEITAHDSPELNELDPPGGFMDKPTVFEIRTMAGSLIGVCTIYNYNGHDLEIGIRIWSKFFWDKGYGKEVIDLLAHSAFLTTDVEYIYMKTPCTNDRAIRCYEKCGFERFDVTMVGEVRMVWMRLLRYGTTEKAGVNDG